MAATLRRLRANRLVLLFGALMLLGVLFTFQWRRVNLCGEAGGQRRAILVRMAQGDQSAEAAAELEHVQDFILRACPTGSTPGRAR